jgi:hypothetical protein
MPHGNMAERIEHTFMREDTVAERNVLSRLVEQIRH